MKSLGDWKEWRGDPLPPDVTSDLLSQVEAHIENDLAPISPEEMLTEIEALRQHYGEWSNLDVASAKRLHRDWIDDFEGFPVALFKLACQRWRRSDARKPPSPGELMAEVKAERFQMTRLGFNVLKARAALNA